MLPGLGFSELLVLGIIALLVVGPKDLPLMMRKLGQWLARLRGMAQEFRSGFDELARQAELDELKREVEALRRHSSFSGIVNEITKPVELSPLPEARATLPRPEHTYTPPAYTAPAPAAPPEPELPFHAGPLPEPAEPELPFDAPSPRTAIPVQTGPAAGAAGG
jgi:sec-independent protein translocase protein TatB